MTPDLNVLVRLRQDDGIVFAVIQFAQASADVAARERIIRSGRRSASWHWRRKLTSRRYCLPVTHPDCHSYWTQGIARIFTLTNSDQSQTLRESTGTSFIECTAISARFSRSALPALLQISLFRLLSPAAYQDHIAARHHRYQFNDQARMARINLSLT